MSSSEIIDPEPGPSGHAAAQLTAEQLATIERNRQKALLRQQKRQQQLTTNEVYELERYNELKINASQDRGGGFFVPLPEQNTNVFDSLLALGNQQPKKSLPIKPDTRENVCDECNDSFSNSFLLDNFNELICDQCKDMKGKHQLITRTEAKQEYLLNDIDLDKREPPLRCLLRKNPHEFARGHMRLYLRFQVEERALEVWGSEERLEEERETRDAKREGRKRKRFDKQMKELRMEARSSLYQKRLQSATAHQHDFGPEKPIKNDDDPDGEYFQQICKTCNFKKIFEKL